MTEAKIEKRISVRDTLLRIPVGEERIIKNKMIKQSVIRATITTLRKSGHEFSVSEAGRIDDVLVKHLK